MRFLSHYLQRTLVFLLLTVFITNTVYASGKMVAALAENNASPCHAAVTVSAGHDCHHQLSGGEALQHGHQTQHQHQHKTSCNDCNHCFACFTVIMPSHLHNISNPDQTAPVIPFAEIYLSPTTAQPQKPPIA